MFFAEARLIRAEVEAKLAAGTKPNTGSLRKRKALASRLERHAEAMRQEAHAIRTDVMGMKRDAKRFLLPVLWALGHEATPRDLHPAWRF